MSDLIQRLRDLQDHYSTSGQLGPENQHVFREAADEIERLRGAAQATREPSAMTERLIQAAVDYEQAGGQHAAAARRELSEARAAIEAALSTVPSTHQRETYCALCDLEHQIHEDAQGFHHVIYGGRVACPVPPAERGGAAS